MKQAVIVLSLVFTLSSCGNGGSNSGNENDSVNTAPITDPSYNPEVEADSAAKHMNLDSTELKDSGRGTLKTANDSPAN